MSSGGGPEECERGHRGRNTELRRSISDMNLSLRRRQQNHVSNDPRGSSNCPNNSGTAQDRKNIVSMINPQPGEVKTRKCILQDAKKINNQNITATNKKIMTAISKIR